MSSIAQSSLRKACTMHYLLIALLTLSCADSEFRAGTPQKSDDARPAARGTPVPTSESTLPTTISEQPDSLLATFMVSQIKEDNIKFSFGPQTVTTDFTLSDINKSQSEESNQNTRTPVSQAFRQGTLGTAMSETFDQKSKRGPVDILLVIDNSGSMKEEQINLSTKLNDLLVAINTADWQISIITTSPAADGSCAITRILSTDADFQTRFKTTIETIGISGNGNEQGFRQAVVGLSCPQTPWVRPAAPVAVLILSDEDNCSNGNGCGNELWNKPDYLWNYVEGTMKRTISKDAGFYGIFAPPAEKCDTARNIGNQYKALVDYKANGAKNYGNICDASYTATLNRISIQIATLLGNLFELAQLPSPGSLKLKLKQGANEAAVPPGDYVLNAKTITFNAGKSPPVNSMVVADYLVGPSTLFNEVTLSNPTPPAAGTVSVKVNGTPLAAGDFIVNGFKIIFTTQPPAMADVMVDYRLNMPLIQTFRLLQAPLANSLKVKINDTATSNYTYNATTREVFFPNPPADGAKLSLDYLYREGPQLSYTIPVNAEASDINLLDGTGPVNFTITNGILSIAAADHTTGKMLRLQYKIPETSTRIFPLINAPIENSTSIDVSSATACAIGSGIEVQGSTLISTCTSATRTDFTFNYKYRIIQRTFTLGSLPNPGSGRWVVLVDSEATTDFVRDNATITLNFEPSIDSRITIQYTFPE